MDAYAMFYIDLLPLVILPKLKHHFRRYGSVRKGDVQKLSRQELNSNVLKSALLHVFHFPKLVLTHCFGIEPKRPYATEGAVAQDMRRYHVTVE